MAALSGGQFKAVLYILMNILSGTCIVFANKLVLSVYQFHFVYALTLIHTVTTMVRALHKPSRPPSNSSDGSCGANLLANAS